jgi:hypothetical protein
MNIPQVQKQKKPTAPVGFALLPSIHGPINGRPTTGGAYGM